jgi:hypothetical protein
MKFAAFQHRQTGILQQSVQLFRPVTIFTTGTVNMHAIPWRWIAMDLADLIQSYSP